MNDTIDFRSDTFSLPSEPMRQYIAKAPVGDDYYGEDPSACRLESYCSRMFGKEAGLFVTTGMLANQLAVAAQVDRGNEVVTEYGYHLHLFESAQYASLCHVLLNARSTADGVLRCADVEAAMRSKPREPMYAQVQLVAVENTIASRQGKVFPFDTLRELRAYTSAHGIALHLDGARVFNAHVASGVPLATYAAQADTVTVSFTKGLGAPFGAMLLGAKPVVDRARSLRMRYGSGYHQIGLCAAAAYYALTEQLTQLAEDHRVTRLLADALRRHGFPVDADGVDTNMVFLDAAALDLDSIEAQVRCRRAGVLVSVIPPSFIRFVVCRNVGAESVDDAAARVASALLH